MLLRSISANAILIRNNEVLVLEYASPERHYNLPGGRLEQTETLLAGVRRKIREEVALEILELGALLAAAEYDPAVDDARYHDAPKLQLNFLCTFDGTPVLPRPFPGAPPHPVALNWLPVDRLASEPLLPLVGETILEGLRQSWNPYCTYSFPPPF